MIAAAAGVAEGTLFRVFDDKDALLAAAVEQALHTSEIESALAHLSPELELDRLLDEVVVVLQRGYADAWRLLRHLPLKQDWEPARELPELQRLLQPHAAALRVTPRRAAAQVAAVTLAMSHPSIYPGGPAPAAEITSLLLNGLLR